MMDSRSFDSGRIAEGYLKRPWLHKSVMEQVKEDCGIKLFFRNGLDVGCGAGLSTKALKLICDRVTGTDISEAMIEVCRKTYKEDGYSFYRAKAEETAVPENQYDIVTAAGVINWVERDKFLKNMSQVMELAGLLIIYDLSLAFSSVPQSESALSNNIPETMWRCKREDNPEVLQFPRLPDR